MMTNQYFKIISMVCMEAMIIFYLSSLAILLFWYDLKLILLSFILGNFFSSFMILAYIRWREK